MEKTKKLDGYAILKESMPRNDEEEEQLEGHIGKSKRIVDRESDYQRRRLNRKLSPPRVDPFALGNKPAPSNLRTYGDAFKDNELERERFYTMRNIEEKKKQEQEKYGEGGDRNDEAQDNFTSTQIDNGRYIYRGQSRSKYRNRSYSPSRRQYEGHRSRSRSPYRGWNGAKSEEEYGQGRKRAEETLLEDESGAEKKEAAVNFGLSGKLAEETNAVNGVTLVYTEPPDAHSPDKNWRFYVFKNGKALEGEGSVLHVHRQSMYLFGRERRIVDIPTDHPSCSKQHAALQFKKVEKVGADGFPYSRVKPYLIDLGSTNGTFINNSQMEAQRYYELLEKDMIKFGSSSREYVILHDKSE